MNDKLLLKDRLLLRAMSQTLAVDDALDHPRRQRIGDHLLLLPEQAEGHLVHTDISTRAHVQGDITYWHAAKNGSGFNMSEQV